MNKTALLHALHRLALTTVFGLMISSLICNESQAQLPSTAAPIDTVFEVDPIGDRDTLYAEINRTGDTDWTINFSYFSDIDLFALSIPVKFKAGLRQVYVDSTIFTGGAVEHFKIKMVRPDTAIQCLTLGLIAALNPNAETLPPGKGRLATVFLHATGDKKAPALTLDTTTTYPANSLMFVQNSKPPINKQTKIFPAFVLTTNEKAEDK